MLSGWLGKKEYSSHLVLNNLMPPATTQTQISLKR